MNRKVTIVLGVIVLIGGFALKSYLGSKAAPPERVTDAGKAPTVLVRRIEVGFVPNKIEVTGKLMADKRIEIFSEVQGVLLPSNKVFKEGVQFEQGERMLRIDSTEFYLNLMATKSNYVNSLVQLGPDIKFDFPNAYQKWNDYVESIDIKKPLPEILEVNDAKQKNFLTSRNVYNQFYSIRGQEEKLTKYNLQAPFSGVLSEGNLQPGTMIRVGQKLGTLIKPGSYELEASLNVNNSNLIQIGDSVILTSQDLPGKWLAKVSRISQHVDKNTQTIKVYINVASDQLREGMYLSGYILSDGFEDATVVPRNLIAGTDQVYLISDSSLSLTKVDVLKISENEVVVKGLPLNGLMLGQVFSGAYNGLSISPKIIKN